MIKGCKSKRRALPYFAVSLMPLLLFTIHTEAYAKEQIAVVIASVGKVSANARTLARRSVIYKGETVNTAANAKVSFKFTDGSVVTLKENSSYMIKNYAFNKSSAPDTFDAHLIKGGLKTITGTIGKEAQHTQDAIEAGIPANQQVKVSHYKVKAAIATIGVRGTTYKCLIDDTQNDDKLLVSALSGTVSAEFADNEQTLGDEGDASYLEIDADGDSSILTSDPISEEDFDIPADDSDDESDSDDADSSDDDDDDSSSDDDSEGDDSDDSSSDDSSSDDSSSSDSGSSDSSTAE